ncbi:unnamed protein product [Rotaria magnacalcarata]|uniref:RanBP2-type domain-containing protein n=1 Tax=Rotaria magnacalcarata TaxID=392030 RepID=A0A819XQW6_9BILA|nr:unnamed protein product [Rotaria magnacalcarata]CAF1349386.1 unnamed protein product [Rotaria magnacalcarata]CAF2025790.1 unnamed protein product [Rotaria magnacalcarata]CAF2148671.1 unnamed protein product [Rotaria magnacalcarata]CAF2209667.1 unnamed protein product [Rotaria magnacalcarata]
MGGKLTVHIDTNAEVIDIHIFTPGQGICLEKRCSPFVCSMIVFQRGLAYGSWYDMLVRVRLSNKCDQQEAYMLKGIYLTVDKCVLLSEVLKWNNCIDNGEKWSCAEKTCQKSNEYGVNICLHCYRNKAFNIINSVSYVPIIGLPFSVTNAVLESGRAAQTGEPQDIANATLATVKAAVNTVLTPMLVGSLLNVPAVTAAMTGTELTMKTLFSKTGTTARSVAMQEIEKFFTTREVMIENITTLVKDTA